MNSTLKIILIGIGIAVGLVVWFYFGLWLITKIVHKMNERSKARFIRELEKESNKETE